MLRADMAELADAKDLGSFGISIQVRSLLSAPFYSGFCSETS